MSKVRRPTGFYRSRYYIGPIAGARNRGDDFTFQPPHSPGAPESHCFWVMRMTAKVPRRSCGVHIIFPVFDYIIVIIRV